MDRVRQKVLKLNWKNGLVVTISGGIIEIEDDNSISLLKNLDQLLYSAKYKSKKMIECKVGYKTLCRLFFRYTCQGNLHGSFA